MSRIQVRDTTIHYEQAGAGRPLLFVHGMCGDARVWQGQLDRLSGYFRCVAYDRRGHSRSGRGTEPESTETHAADAAALIEALGLVDPVVVGSSGGARIAVELARTRPDLLAGAVFAEPPIMSLAEEAGQALLDMVSSAVRPAAESGGPAAVDAFFTAVCPGLWSTLEEARKDRYRANAPMMMAELTGPAYPLTTTEARAITLPCLVMAGTTSHPALRAIAVALANALPRARLLTVDGSGHVIYAERPDEFAAAVAAFATELALVRDPRREVGWGLHGRDSGIAPR
ncbi:MAG TPA: alpha/beta hydrolase [Pseudonocardiaceae bacterium]|nr:alpha/beta hydrolase [Pseudonocardiaceae bacterium]